MGQSYVDAKTEIMHRLLWQNFLRSWVETTLWTIPWIGPFLKLPPVDALLMALISDYLEKPLLRAMVRFGVFTSIDWQEEEIYGAYAAEAEKLLPLQGKPEWDPEDEKKFTDAARNLIRFHLRTV